eukprot:CAMPEP_0179090420 /NCGR_PEP_ID=MMETSP0796-20121207/41251_1 /TAXON_ID=73915 /ORGANISM="Pyrodinium bahamense, Strain pbaha01" /LENGTH=768 /DNA_ID=CAMNT_0020787991 /DNA_START=60 /DNA_END=2366 /DNA_ORIENTATION=+
MAPNAPVSSSSLGELYSKCVQMVNENKISTKNAFDLHLIDHMDDIVDSFMGGRKRKAAAVSTGGRSSKSTGGQPQGETEAEHRFHEASCTIEASARIYACRVDCVHTDTYRVLGGLSSADMADEEEGKEGEKGGAAKKRRMCGVNTLERNEANIIQQHIEADEQSDPTFRRMAAAFDAGGAKGLLLSHLAVAEDLSLVFNGDVPLNRAAQTAGPMFERPGQAPADKLGVGDLGAFCSRLTGSRLCPPELDVFRRQLFGDVETIIALPTQLEALLGPEGPASAPPVASSRPPAQPPVARAPTMPPLQDEEEPCPGLDDGPSPSLDAGAPPPAFAPEQSAASGAPAAAPGELALDAAPAALEDQRLLPLADAEAPQALAEVGTAKPSEDVVAFDELFEKFCSGGGSHQFAYFDECWAKLPSEKEGWQCMGALADAQEGALVAAPEAQEVKEKPSKRPLFDLSNLDKPLKPIDTEPVHKHQLSERAVHWQLHKDVPPYMIDRITMPSWQTWSKCDFACLGLRPHLMLKLVRKPQPEGEGPHSFSDLFSTVVVENPEAFPWLAGHSQPSASSHARHDDADEDVRAERGDADLADEAAEEDFDANGLPSHFDVDPQELFLRPEDTVVPGLDQGECPDLPEVGGEDAFAGGEDAAFMPGIDFDLVDQPATVGSTDIGYSRNSKFVDVKLVKKHLWDCISEDIAEAKAAAKPRKAASSFQGLVDRTVQRLPKSETENLSVAVCFICALHLCNEKGLELAPEPSAPLGDFAVVGPP